MNLRALRDYDDPMTEVVRFRATANWRDRAKAEAARRSQSLGYFLRTTVEKELRK